MKILVIGGGKMGLSHLALLTHYVSKSSVVLLDNNSLTLILYRILGYKTYKKLDKINPKNLNCVFICTPTSSHYFFVRWCISNSIPCFVEKPLTLSPSKSLDLIKFAEDNKSYVQVGFVMRYVSSFQRLKKIISKNELGKVISYNASFKGNVVSKKLDNNCWLGDFKRGGGCLNEYGPHLIDLCNFIFGRIIDVRNVEKNHIYSTNADDQILLTWMHESGVLGDIDINWSDSTKRKSILNFKVKFEYADLLVDNSHINIVWNKTTNHQLQKSNSIDIHPSTTPVNFYLRGEEFSLEIEDFLEHCKKKPIMNRDVLSNDTTPSLDSGYEVDRLIETIAIKVGLK